MLFHGMNRRGETIVAGLGHMSCLKLRCARLLTGVCRGLHPFRSDISHGYDGICQLYHYTTKSSAVLVCL